MHGTLSLTTITLLMYLAMEIQSGRLKSARVANIITLINLANVLISIKKNSVFVNICVMIIN